MNTDVSLDEQRLALSRVMPELLDEHRGRWVVFADSRVVAISDGLDGAFEDAEREGVLGRCVIERVLAAPENIAVMPFLSARQA